MCISLSQLLMNIGIAVFAGIAIFVGIAVFAGIAAFTVITVFAHLRHLNMITCMKVEYGMLSSVPANNVSIQ